MASLTVEAPRVRVQGVRYHADLQKLVSPALHEENRVGVMVSLGDPKLWPAAKAAPPACKTLPIADEHLRCTQQPDENCKDVLEARYQFVLAALLASQVSHSRQRAAQVKPTLTAAAF
jgi:hypothetical protein